ncbi:hypothetical protein LPJGGPFB_04269 [Ensifer adhaerens]|uniref:GNAT family N-acetyltransferase n=1 Tax=Ensifer adhaerens TaxID=106592 RepID=UPI001569B289|nr:GNAT family protein [Ensifer adhaerens]NRP21010.1 hypothetical protein [Ensifer adhaerens]
MTDVSTSEIMFRRFTNENLGAYRAWFADAEIARFLSYPTDDWFAHVSGSVNARCWAAIAPDGVMLAEIQVDRDEDGVGHIELAVRPDLRGKGYGKRILLAFLSGPGSVFAELHAHVEIDNAASLSCFKRCNFVVAAEQDDDEFCLMAWRPGN